MKTAVIGSFVVDLMARAPHLPEPGETVMGSCFKAGPGGKGSNQAIAAKRAGGDVVFATKIGCDDFSKLALDAFLKNEISLDYILQTDTAPTGVALISVDEQSGQNKIIVVLGACNTFDQADIQGLEKALTGCEYLLLEQEINPDATQRLIDIAYGRGIRVILNTAPVSKLPGAVYEKLYLVTPNEVEARILTGVSCDTNEGCKRAANIFFEKGVKKVIITLGKRGVYLNDAKEEHWLPNYEVPVLDTTGAGDAFNGGLLAGLSKGMPLREAAQYANVVSNLAVTKLGTALAMPTKEEIEQFITRHGLLGQAI